MSQKPASTYSTAEEIAHGTTHGIGALLSVAGLVVMVVFGSMYGDAWHVVSCSIYGATLVWLYTSSTLYHSFPWPRVKGVFRRLDHTAIYLLIAGTYTPFALVSLRGGWGWTLFGLVWGLALLGVIVELTVEQRRRTFSVALYLALGWLMTIAAKPLVMALEPAGLALLLGGGLAYTVGVVFYAWNRLPYNHFVWHLFVLGGSVCHFFAVLLYVLPTPQ